MPSAAQATAAFLGLRGSETCSGMTTDFRSAIMTQDKWLQVDLETTALADAEGLAFGK
jgi:hypothetical protein